MLIHNAAYQWRANYNNLLIDTSFLHFFALRAVKKKMATSAEEEEEKIVLRDIR